MKFYKKGDAWIVRKRNEDNDLLVFPSDYTIEMDESTISIYKVTYGASNPSFILLYNEKVTDIDKNEDGDKYADMNDFLSALSGFSTSSDNAGIPTGLTVRFIDEGATVTYIGYALVGTLVSEEHQIKKINSSINPIVITYARGAWTDRLALAYS